MDGANVAMTDYRFTFARNFILTSVGNISDITAISFDVRQELLWVCNSMCKVASFFGGALDPYTSFTLPNSAARTINVFGDAVAVLVKDGLFAYKRQGTSLFYYGNDNFEDLTSMCVLPIAPNFVVLGGRQRNIVQMDLETQKERRLIFVKDSDCLLSRASDRYFYNTDSSGKLVMRSLDTMEPINTVAAHDGGIYDFDVCGNKIITCGYTSKGNQPFSDPFLKVYDSRNMKGIPPVSLHYPPLFCRFANSFADGRVLVTTKYGQLLSVDLNGYQMTLLHQSCDSVTPTAMNVSSSGQCAVVGDQQGCVSLFVDREDAVFNPESWSTMFASVEDCLPPLSIDNINSKLSCIPTPLPPPSGYCSDQWLDDCIRRKFRKPKPINPDLLQSTRSVQSVRYAKSPNIGTSLRGLNVCPYETSDDEESEKQTSMPTNSS